MAENSPHHSSMLIRGANGALYLIAGDAIEQHRLPAEQARELEAELAKRGIDLKHENSVRFRIRR